MSLCSAGAPSDINDSAVLMHAIPCVAACSVAPFCLQDQYEAALQKLGHSVTADLLSTSAAAPCKMRVVPVVRILEKLS